MSEDQLSQADRPKFSRVLGRRLIKQRFQLKFSLIVLGFLSVAMFVIWLEGRYAVEQLTKEAGPTSQQFVLQLQLVNDIIAKTCLIALAVVFGLSLFFSHFVAGPIYRFEKTLEAMRGGDLTTHIKLRKHDEFQEVADLFNQTLASLRNKIKKDRDSFATALNPIVELAAQLKGEGRVAEAKVLDDVLDLIRKTPPQIKI